MSENILGEGPRMRSTFDEPQSIEGRPMRYYANSDTMIYYGDVTYTAEESGGVITDFYSTEPPPWPFRPVSQFKWDFSWIGHGSCQIGNPSCKLARVDTLFDFGYYWNPLGLQYDDVAPKVAVISDFEWEISVLLDQCLDVIQAPTDLLVFLAEMRDLVSMMRDIMKAINAAKALVSSNVWWEIITGINLMISAGAAGTVNVIVDKVAAGLLSYSFAWRPFISDTVGIIDRLFKLQRRYDQIKDGVGKVHRTSRTTTVRIAPTEEVLSQWNCTASNSGNYCYAGGPLSIRRHTRKDLAILDPKLSATVAYRYELPSAVTSVMGDLGTLLSLMGVNPSLETVWDVIPFSFVVDWFIPVGDWLGRVATVSPSSLKIEIVDICASIKSGRTSALTHCCPCSFGENFNREYCVATRSDYDRVVGKELLNALPSFRIPSKFQLLLGAALIRANA